MLMGSRELQGQRVSESQQGEESGQLGGRPGLGCRNPTGSGQCVHERQPSTGTGTQGAEEGARAGRRPRAGKEGRHLSKGAG